MVTTDLPLFAAGPEPEGPYKVPGLTSCGQRQQGDWLQIWAEAPRPLHSLQDREAVMRALALEPDDYKILPPAPINKTEKKGWRTWWYCWPKALPDPGVRP